MNAALKTPIAFLLPAWRALVPRLRRRPAGEAELRAMGERELRDLGIGAGEIPHLLQQERVRRGR